MKRLLLLLSLTPSLAIAWEDADLLSYIMQNNPVMQSHQQVVNEYTLSKTWMDRIKRGSTLVARATAGGSEFVDSSSTVFGGINISIPFSTENERRDRALKQLNRATASDELKSRILSDMSKLRQMEAELEAASIQIKFWRDKLEWTKKRIETGYAEQSELWDIGQKINAGKAAIAGLDINIKNQQHTLSRYAGNSWQVVLKYLNGKGGLWA